MAVWEGRRRREVLVRVPWERDLEDLGGICGKAEGDVLYPSTYPGSFPSFPTARGSGDAFVPA